jgi:hypothetical protein
VPSEDGIDESYYVGAKIRLSIRIDEFGATGKLATPKSTLGMKGVVDPKAPLSYSPDPANPGRFLLQAKGSGGSTNAAAGDQARSSDGLTFDITVIPKSMTWSLASIRQGDTLQASIKWIDCPLDPRCIRACSVDAFIGSVSNNDFAAGIAGQTPDYADSALNTIKDTWTDAKGNQRTNLRFRGWVDKWEIEWTDEGEPVINLECTDNTRLFIDQQMLSSPNLHLDKTLTLDKAIAQFLSNFPQFDGLSVEFRPSTATPPTLKTIFQGLSGLDGPPPDKAGGTDHHSIWDYLTDICGACGQSIFLQGDVVVIQSARTLTSNDDAQTNRKDDPFQGRTVAGETFSYRRFIFGRNIKEMRMSRHYTHNKPTNIEVRSVNFESKPPLLVARFPPTGKAKNGQKKRQAHAIPGNSQPNEKWKVIKLHGIKDLATLKLIAQNYYEQYGRNEIQVEVKTRNLASWGAGNLDPDILDMKFGDTFELLVNRDPDEASTLTRIEKALSIQGANANLLKALGFAADFATTYGQAFANVGVPTLYVLKELHVEWNIEQGIDITAIGVNYIEVRADQAAS